MNCFRRALACASLIAVAAGSAPASAQQIDRIVAFGDSYPDTGNAFALGYANPQALFLYQTRRFSGGTNYIDTLASILHVPVENFAIGGAFGGSNNGTLCFDPFYAPGTSPLCGKGLQYEVDQFLNVGAQSAVFPNASTTFTEHDLLAISIGGNDSRFYQQAGGTLAGAPAAGTAAAGGTAVQLDRLAAQGNPTISFLALNGAVAPEVALDPNAQAIRGAFSTAYYTSLQPTLAGIAANGSIVHYLDGQLLLQNVAANPSAFGITSVGPCPQAQLAQCVTDPNFVNQFLFYVDGLHLTSHGFEIVGQYVARQLAAPLTLQAPSDLGFDTARQFGRTLSTRSDLYGRGTVKPGLKLFAIGDFFSRDVPTSNDTATFDIDGVGGTIGAEYGLSMGSVGIAANYSRPRVRFGNESARINAHSWQLGIYGNAASGGLFGQGYLGYGWDENKITRTGVVDDMHASPNGSHFIAGAKGGYLMPVGPARVGPIAALDYARAKVDGYTESGDAALNLNVGGQSLKAVIGQIGLEARADFTGIRPYLDLTAEHDFSGNGRVIGFAQTSAPTIVNHWTVSRDKDTYGRASLGAAADLWNGGSLDAAVTTTIGRDGGRDTGAHIGVRASF
jgi:outer membrane lipase/esterase